MVTLFYVYVDDMLIVDRNDKIIKSTKDILNSRFDMKYMDPADVILRIKITRTSHSLILSQSYYINKIIEKFNKDDFGVARNPIDSS